MAPLARCDSVISRGHNGAKQLSDKQSPCLLCGLQVQGTSVASAQHCGCATANGGSVEIERSENVYEREMGGEKGTIFLDPVDGTHNALAGIPFYALSIAYAEEGEVRQGFVRDLAHRETFTARQGKGAFLDGKPIRVSRTQLLEESAMSVYGRKFNPRPVLFLGQKIRRWRLLGASALELCYVAAGRLDGFIDLRATLRVTDAAAGMLVCEEAGGKVSDLEGRRIRFPDEVTVGKCLVASNGTLHGKVIEYLR